MTNVCGMKLRNLAQSGRVKAKFEDTKDDCRNDLYHSKHQNHPKLTSLLHYFTEKICKIMRKQTLLTHSIISQNPSVYILLQIFAKILEPSESYKNVRKNWEL